MVLGIGTDIIEISRVKRAIASEHFRARVYTAAERAYCEARGAGEAASFAARFAGKEAVLKAFGTGLRGGSMQDVEILDDALGCPQVTLHGYYRSLAAKKGSHAREYATAQCVMEGENS